MEKLVFSLDQDAGPGPDLLGAKAAGLLKLQKNGFNVPEGFCITSDAYGRHLEVNSEISYSNLKAIQASILNKAIDPALVLQIEKCYLELEGAVLAVRSSATAEDLPGHSFAGQYDTFLNVKTFDDCLEAVKKCWASVWSERAFRYRQKNGINHSDVKMAVIVQRLIDAECAGVIFTADPVYQRRDRIVIESCRGLGDKLVSGIVRPDRFVFDKHDGKLLQFSKADDNEGSSLDEKKAAELAGLAIKIERAFGGPQDIEWAIEGGSIFFLQSRPVTTIKERSFEERQVWTNMNSAEVMPDVVTPMTWSVLNKMLKPWFRSLWRMMGTDLDEHIVVGLVAGRAYFNVNTMVASAQHLPSYIQDKLLTDRLQGGKTVEKILASRLSFQKEDLPDLKGSMWKTVYRIPEGLYRLFKHRPSKSSRFLEHLKKVSSEFEALNFREMSDEELCGLLKSCIKRELEKWDLLCIASAMIYYPAFRYICEEKLKDTNGNIENALIRGQEGMEDVQAGFDLWKLAATANKSEFVRTAVLSAGSYNELAKTIGGAEQSRDFLKGWYAFMAEHGHHCRGELELYNARWSEQPDYILKTVKTYLLGIDKTNPIENRSRLETSRQKLIKQCLEKLGNPINKFLFKYLITKIQFGMKIRENWKSRAVKLLSQFRRGLLEMGNKLHAAGILENADDIFFLELEEIHPAAEYNSIAQVRKKIKSRRDEYEENKKLSPPHLVIGRYMPEGQEQDESFSNATVLKGLTVCPGKVRGRARVVLRADESQQVLAGEILVAPVTDPAWTPYFMTSAGIVMDQGGMLSHGSIVARELGIPAVVNVGPATKIIKTGQMIEVDANEGVVRILT